MIFKKSSILTSFREYGLILYNSIIVLKKIKKYQSSFSSFLNRLNISLEVQIWSSITSLTTRSLEKHVIYLQNTISSRQKVLQEKFIKETLI